MNKPTARNNDRHIGHPLPWQKAWRESGSATRRPFIQSIHRLPAPSNCIRLPALAKLAKLPVLPASKQFSRRTL